MKNNPIDLATFRRNRAARDLVRSWRSLAGGTAARDDERPTLVACSGGADSSALAIVLSLVPAAKVIIAHVVHDMRTAEEALADRDAVRALAQRLGRPFVEAFVSIKNSRGNAESVARTKRYRALARLARANHCPFVAVAHQGDDLLETMLMRLLRGAGPRGLAAIAPARPLTASVTLIRPMLALSRADSERLCRAAEWTWCEDRTNSDPSRFRAALRSRVTPVLKELSARAIQRVSASAQVLRETADYIAGRAKLVLDEGRAPAIASAAPASGQTLSWSRDRLRGIDPAVLSEVVRQSAAELCGGRSRDRLSHVTLRRVRGAVLDGTGGERLFSVAGVRIVVRASQVELCRGAA